MSAHDELNVSLEPHLLEVLNPLQTLLPNDLAAELSNFISPPSSLILHSTLLKISKWSRSPAGLEALRSSSLDPQSYSMISLLAGTRTSPEKKFPAYVAKDPEAERKQAADDRKAVSTVVNGVLSVAGTGFATWWASEYTGLRLEWVRRSSPRLFFGAHACIFREQCSQHAPLSLSPSQRSFCT